MNTDPGVAPKPARAENDATWTRRSLAVAALATALAAGGCAGGAQAHGPARLYPAGATPQGHSYAAIAGAYANWGFSVPVSTSPVLHPDSPRNCEVHGDFLYVGSAGTAHTCVVQAGTPVVLSFAGYECSTAEGNGATFAKLRRCAQRQFARTFAPDHYRFGLRLDGAPAPHPRRWTFTTTNQVIDLPTKNLWHAPAGPTKSVSRGMVYVLRPLSPGRHIVRVHAVDAEMGKLDFVYRFRSAS